MPLLKVLLLCFLLFGFVQAQPTVALSFDDPNILESPTATWQQRNLKILRTLHQHRLRAALFVCGMRVHSESGRALLQTWDDAGHLLGNHSYNHSYFAGKKVSCRDFERELLRTDSLLMGYAHFERYFRFPFLKEGNTAARRDSMRQILTAHAYRNGHVGIDASDWYVDQMLCDSLIKNPKLNPLPYRKFYLLHIVARATYYDSIATALTGRKVPLVLLLHHNWINALFLGDVIQILKAKGWKFIDVQDAYRDVFYAQVSDALPAGESLVWSLAKATGRFEKSLRYPAEDGEYEESALKQCLQQAAKKIDQ
jgi:peptidoglycan-N-acetylglucosamine deacetylase